MKRAILVLALLFTPALAAFAEAPAGEGEPVISRFSGEPVPRFEMLRWAEVNGRVGPSLSYPIAWRYNRKGLPVLVVKESGEWRRVRDPDGDEVWIHRRMLERGTTGWIVRSTLMNDGPASDAGAIAEVGEGVLVQVETCLETSCRVRAGNFRGWVARASIWGAGAPEIRTAATNG